MLRCPLSSVLAPTALAVLAALAVPAASIAQDAKPAPVGAPAVEVPAFPNPTCPIMGKKVSLPLFVDTDLGRFYVCCKPCYKKVLADLPAAHKTAYPNVETIANKTCPVTGATLGDDAVEVTLQGFRFRVANADAAALAVRHSQTTLVKLTRPAVVDVGNTTCPVTGGDVAPNAFVLIGDHLVHLGKPAAAEDAAKDPAAVLAKAKTLPKAPKPPAPAKESAKEPAKEPGK
jgi:hypothetical protein